MTAKLGDTARDSISGFEGVVTSRHEYLNGCTRLGISPKTLKDGKPIDTCMFDDQQVELVEAANAPAAPPRGGPQEMPRDHQATV